MAGIVKKVKAFLRLIRIHSLIVTAITPLLGACATFSVLKGGFIPFDQIIMLFNLFLIGVIVHIFGETLNDYIDYDVDKANIELSEKPLVSGDISKKGAFALMAISLTVMVIIGFFSRFNLLSLSIFIIAAVTGIIYQLKSKKWLHSAIFLSAWAFFIILFGGVYAGQYQSLLDVPVLVYIISILGFFHLWVNTAILGHLKDVKNDAECGVKTFPIRFGVKVLGDDKTPKLIIPMNFRIFVLIIQVINLIVAFVPLIFYKMFYDGDINLLLLYLGLALVSIMILGAQYKILWHEIFERNKLMRKMAIREIGTYFLAIVIIAPLVGWILSLIFILLPLVWFLLANLIFSGNPMQPSI